MTHMMKLKYWGCIAYLYVLGIPRHEFSQLPRQCDPDIRSQRMFDLNPIPKTLLRRIPSPHILIERNLGIPKLRLSDIPPYVPPNILITKFLRN